MIKSSLAILAALCSGPVAFAATPALTIRDRPDPSTFPLVGAQGCAPLVTDAADAKVVELAASAFASDLRALTGKTPALLTSPGQLPAHPVIIGTLGQSAWIDRLAADGKIPTAEIRGRWEAHLATVVQDPFPGIDSALVLAGADRRGTAYAVFDLSRKLGVSPWIWWADVVPAPRPEIHLAPGLDLAPSPAVKYRGIFLNDEDWGLQPWAAKQTDPEVKDIGPKTYAKIFELLLRLHANALWPAMHPCTKAFFHYPGNAQAANDYAIVVGSSHCEPMLRNNVFEWKENYLAEYGQKPGAWDFLANRDSVLRYWEDRIRQTADMEVIYTLGMRGIHDSPMAGPKSAADRAKVLADILAMQRRLLAKHKSGPVESVPQIFCPYKEVLQIYQAGLQVPEDVTLMWADDNHGYLRQLSTPVERRRSGGSGIYYHLSYWGAPQDYLWLSSTSPALLASEMGKALAFGADRIWIANVGDIKPAELETQFFLDLARTPSRWTPETAADYPRQWAAEIFGDALAEPIARIKLDYYRLNQSPKPEHLLNFPFTRDEMTHRLGACQELLASLAAIDPQIPERLRDAWFELVAYPVEASCRMNEMHLCAQLSFLAADDAEAAALAKRAEAAYARIQELTRRYNQEIAGGKWDGMMSSHPRDLQVFKMPPAWRQDATRTAQKTEASDRPPALLGAADIVRKGDSPLQKICVARGLGWKGAGFYAWPLRPEGIDDADATTAPFVECSAELPAGKYRLNLRCLPTQRPYPGRALRCAIVVGEAAPAILDLQTPDGSSQWKTNVIRGYAEKSLRFTAPGGHLPIRLYLLDPGLVVNQLAVVPEADGP